jgi:hypothetical protein
VDARVPSLEAALRDLRSDFDAYRARPLPPAPPPKADSELVCRLERAESVLAGLRAELATVVNREEARAGAAATKGEVKNLDLRMTDLNAAFDGLKRSLSGEGEMAARLLLTESELAEVKTAFAAHRYSVRRSLEALVPKEEIEALRVGLAAALDGLADVKRSEAQYAGEFAEIESECRKALGEMQGYVEASKEKSPAARFDEHLKNSLGKMNGKLAEVETALHAGLTKLSSRLNGDRVLYDKMFAEAEERVRAGLAPELKAAEGETKWLRENVIWLMDEYKVVMERKIRALEGKYSAFEAISKRMDTISEVLQKGDNQAH